MVSNLERSKKQGIKQKPDKITQKEQKMKGEMPNLGRKNLPERAFWMYAVVLKKSLD